MAKVYQVIPQVIALPFQAPPSPKNEQKRFNPLKPVLLKPIFLKLAFLKPILIKPNFIKSIFLKAVSLKPVFLKALCGVLPTLSKPPLPLINVQNKALKSPLKRILKSGLLPFAYFFCVAFFFSACSKESEIAFSCMNTAMTIKVECPKARKVALRCKAAIKDLESSILRIYDDKVPNAFFAVRSSKSLTSLTNTMLLAERDTGGAFNPFMRSLSKLWGFGRGASGTFIPPSKSAINKELLAIKENKALFCSAWQKAQQSQALNSEKTFVASEKFIVKDGGLKEKKLASKKAKNIALSLDERDTENCNKASTKSEVKNKTESGKSFGDKVKNSTTESFGGTIKSDEKLGASSKNEDFTEPFFKNFPLDYGGAAKGFAGDLSVSILKEENAKSALLDLGGNIVVFGEKSDGSPWVLGVRDPFKAGVYCVLKIEGKAASATHVITSGGYERFHTDATGRRYCHILDGRKGECVDNDLASVTIIGEDGALCDSLATALFVMGSADAKKFYESKKYTFEYLLIKKDGKIEASKGVDWKK